MTCVAKIAVAVSSPAGAAAELSNSIEEITGVRPQWVRLRDLAGPNATLQLLLDAEGWILVLKAVAAVYGFEIVKEMAKSTWKTAAPTLANAASAALDKVNGLVSILCSAARSGTTVILGLPTTPDGARRHVGIEIIDANPQEVTRIICVLAAHATEIETSLSSIHCRYAENSDCSVKLTLTDSGAIQFWGVITSELGESREVVAYEIPNAPLQTVAANTNVTNL